MSLLHQAGALPVVRCSLHHTSTFYLTSVARRCTTPHFKFLLDKCCKTVHHEVDASEIYFRNLLQHFIWQWTCATTNPLKGLDKLDHPPQISTSKIYFRNLLSCGPLGGSNPLILLGNLGRREVQSCGPLGQKDVTFQ